MQSNVVTLPDNQPLEIVRERELAKKIVIVDGQPGCGKTMLSRIVTSIDRVEILHYAYEVEYACRLHRMGKIEHDAAVALVRMLTDLKTYNMMMGRDTNFRISDLSGVLSYIKPWKYFMRIFQEGDRAVPERIEREQPILNLTTHNLLAYAAPLFEALENRLVYIELVRHPLYMIKQQALNMEVLPTDPRDVDIYFKYRGETIPYYTLGWEEKFVTCNPIERAIYWMENMTRITDEKRKQLLEEGRKIITIPFEKFVTETSDYMETIVRAMGSRLTFFTKRELKRQKVPRKMYADGIDLKVYRRYKWEPAQTSSEVEEFAIRRNFAKEQASPEAMKILDQLSESYEKQYLS